MSKLEDLELVILRSVESGGVLEVPDEFEDGGHTAWLLSEGYIEDGDGRLRVTRKGRAALLGREDDYVDLDDIEFATLARARAPLQREALGLLQ